jgi:hypothetical protein
MMHGIGLFIYADKFRHRLQGMSEDAILWIIDQSVSAASVRYEIGLGAEMGISADMKVVKEDGAWMIDACKTGSAGV